MIELSLSTGVASNSLKCSLCQHAINPGEVFWRARHDGGTDKDALWICTSHVPLNTKGMIIEPSDDETEISFVRAEAVDVRKTIISRLLKDYTGIFSLTAEEFEELIFDRVLAMGMQGFRMGPSNRKDGGIDIVFWTCGILPILGAIQVKHHQSPMKKVRVSDVRDFAGAMEGHNFNVGLLITNTSFTKDASHQARKGFPILLRDGSALQKWVSDDFSIETLEFVTRNAEFCRGRMVNVPRFV